MILIIGLYLTLLFLLNLPFIQKKSTLWASKELSSLLDCEVKIGYINMGWLNRVVLDDVEIKDQDQESLLSVARLTAKFEIIPLLKGRISIRTVQLFSFDINLYKKTPDAEPNFKFIVDALKSDKPSTTSSIDLRINAILIRRGNLSYDVHTAEQTPNQFNAKHVRLENILANVSLKALSNDSINAHIKRLSLNEQSGFDLKKLTLKVTGNNQGMSIEEFALALPETHFELETINLEFDSLGSFKKLGDEVEFDLKTRPSYLTLKDFQAFTPVLKNFEEKLSVSLAAHGKLNDFELPILKIQAMPHFSFEGNASIQDLLVPNEAFLYINLPLVSANQEGLLFIARNFNPTITNSAGLIQRLGYATFKGTLSGYINDLIAYGKCSSGLGDFDIDMKLGRNLDKNLFSFEGGLKTSSFNIGELINNKELGHIALNFELNGQKKYNLPYPDIILKGAIDSLSYNKYTYHNISIDGEFKSGGFDGSILLDDTNGSFSLLGNFNLAKQIPTFDFNASFRGIRPKELNLSKTGKESEWSMDVNANFTGGALDQMNGSLSIEDLRLVTSEEIHKMKYFNVNAIHTDKINQLVVDSEFLKGKIEGQYSYQTLPQSFQKLLYNYLPALSSYNPKTDRRKQPSNIFKFNLDIYNTDILYDFFDIPLRVFTHSSLNGLWDDTKEKYSVKSYFPKFQYKTTYIESGVFLFDNFTDAMQSSLRFNHQRKNSAVTVALNLEAKENTLLTQLHWGNSHEHTYSGTLNGKATFTKPTIKDSLRTKIDINETQIILNDSIWNLYPSTIYIAENEISVDNFKFSHLDQYLHIDGKVSTNPQDTLQVDLNDINISYIFEMANIKETVDFNGNATGKAIAADLYNKPLLQTDLHIKDFSFNDVRLGDMDIKGQWDIEEEGIQLEADIKEEEVAQTLVKGYIYPLAPKSGLNLTFDAKNINVGFIEYYTQDILSLDGRASGLFNFYGPFSALNMEAKPYVDGTLNIHVLNTGFHVKDTLHMTTDGIQFNQIAITDVEGNKGEVNGNLFYQHFRDLTYDFNVMSNNMLVMNTQESKDTPFYGRIYASGNTQILGGGEEGVNINVAMTTNRNTSFTYSLGSVASATSREFIQFNDITPQRIPLDSLNVFNYGENVKSELESSTDIHLNLQMDITPDAQIKIMIDPLADDYISGKGQGNIRTEFYNKGDVKLFGNYTIQQGVYKFSIQEVIRKNFVIREGGTINFNGDPLNANVDVLAAHTVNSVSLNDLIPNAQSLFGQNYIKVNCLMHLSGALYHPTFRLNLELPNEQSEVETIVRNYINTEEEMNLQFLYLLSIGKFYTQDRMDNQQNSDVMSSVLSSTLSGQLNNMLSHIVDNSNWTIGTNLSTGTKGWTEVEVEGVLSGQLLNNRLLINGNFGYRDNPMTNTNFVGDFEAEWLVNRSGDIRLRAYNKTNDQYYIRSNYNTQGVGIIFRKDFNKWRDLFFWRNRIKKQNTNQQDTEEIVE